MNRIGSELLLGRCPHCAIAGPNFVRVYHSEGPLARRDGHAPVFWDVHACTTCGSLVSARAKIQPGIGNPEVEEIFPSQRVAHEDIPEPAKTFLNQAYQTLHAPDAAALMAGSAVDAMLKKTGLTEGSLYTRIDEAEKRGYLTTAMATWAHAVRLGANRPRHADADNPHVSPGEAKQSVEFAEALGNFLFVLTARIERGIQAAVEA